MTSSSPQAVSPQHSLVRVFAGGLFMGLANLVPGVSGGTMILALGLYDRFIGAVAELTTLRPKRATLVFLTVVAIGLAVAVLGMSTSAVWLVTEHRWIAYSLFIGLTLGGVPLLLRVIRPLAPAEIAGIAVGLGLMAAVAFGLRNSALPQNIPVFVGIGAVAATSMILPGISGSYILLIFGLYDVVIGSLRPNALLEAPGESLGVVVPVGIGAVLGIGLFSNVLKFVLTRFDRVTHSVLLGLLLGSVLGLWPFQEAVHPELATRSGVNAIELLLAGEELNAVEAETGVVWEAGQAEELRTRYAENSRGDLKLLGLQLTGYRPNAVQILWALCLVAGGFLLTRFMGVREDAEVLS